MIHFTMGRKKRRLISVNRKPERQQTSNVAAAELTTAHEASRRVATNYRILALLVAALIKRVLGCRTASVLRATSVSRRTRPRNFRFMG